MPFTSPVFLFLFLPVTLLVYRLIPRKGLNIYLFCASLFFYAWGNWSALPLILGLLGTNWAIARMKNRVVLTIGVIINVGALAVYKYTPSLFGIVGLPASLPLGFSFFTFHSISYLIDSCREKAHPGSLLTTGLYTLFFPIVTAGPITRYESIAPSLSARTMSPDETNEGVIRFITGLAQKVLIADVFGVYVNRIFTSPATITSADAWMGIILYTLQIYFDFTGYSSMAIGIGKMLGFRLTENFDYPYRATSIGDFWQRWHISLTTWLRNYVYFPLGGNRKGMIRTYLNIAAVFIVSGLWHGTGLTFLVWGMWHGFWMIVEKAFERKMRIPQFFQHLYALIIIMVGWIVFRSSSVSAAWVYLTRLFAGQWSLSQIELSPYLIVLTLGSIVIAGGLFRQVKVVWPMRFLWYAVLFGVSLVAVAGSTYTPFIYARF